MDGLTAKVFRTYNASITMQDELLKLTDDSSTVAEKVLAYNRANREVAVLCNHQRAVSKTHGDQVNKISDKIIMMKYDLMKLREQLVELEPKLKKSKPELFEELSDLDNEETIEKCEALIEAENEKKLEKHNAKLIEKGDIPLKKLPAQNRNFSVEQLEKKIEKLNARIHNLKTQLVDREENKTTSLGTSKINYIDPRITAAWCSKHNVPLDKMFSKTLQSKFKWAMVVDETFEF